MTVKNVPSFTDKFIKSLNPNGTAYRKYDGLNDPSLKGFHVQVSPSGNKTFTLSFTSPELFELDSDGSIKTDSRGKSIKKRRFYKLGTYPDISLKDARDKCRELRSFITENIDPVEELERKRLKEQHENDVRNKQGTVEQLFHFYIKDLELDEKASANEVTRIYLCDIHGVIGHMKTKDVSKRDCAKVIKNVADRGSVTMANRVRSYLHAAFTFGIFAEDEPRWMEQVPYFGLKHNPVAQTRRPLKSERVGERALSRDEIKILLTSLDKNVMKPSFTLALKLLVSTGQRVRQLLEAEWSEINFEEKIWEIPEKRNRKGAAPPKRHAVALTGFHVRLLKQLRGLSDGKYLFPNEQGDGPLDDERLRKALTRFCKPNNYSDGIEKFTLRDIRRTWKTLAASIGLELELRNRIQGHALSDVGSRHYDRYNYLNEKRAGMERYTNWLESVIRGDSNVIPLSRTGN